jgi:hypothetical protein
MEKFKIYIDRLKNGQEIYDETVPPEFLKIQEQALHFRENIRIKGMTYLTSTHLITCLNIEASAFIPCCICNEMVRIPITIKNLCLSHPIEEIKTAIFDLSDEIRESILIDIPQFTECNQGKCPHRSFVQQFLNKKSTPSHDTSHFPFSDL